jgi:peptidoglycan L-alanyl-D-glutamate endopeptidase CwlK
MNKFGKVSLERLTQADPRWEEILNELLKHMDVTILCTHRGQVEQDKAYHTNKSKLKWPNSKHNSLPSIAVDIAPYPIDWNNTKRFGYMAGLVVTIGAAKGHKVRWGGDWDSDGETQDQNFHDLPHFELV